MPPMCPFGPEAWPYAFKKKQMGTRPGHPEERQKGKFQDTGRQQRPSSELVGEHGNVHTILPIEKDQTSLSIDVQWAMTIHISNRGPFSAVNQIKLHIHTFPALPPPSRER